MAKKNTPITPTKGNHQITKLPTPQANPYNLQAVKRYIFNETGNIMLASTDLEGAQIAQEVRDIFAEVAVFFAAMTKAISTTINPETNKPYSLYNYNAIQNVIDGSGLFVHVTEEDIEHSTTSFGASFSKELIEGLLGLATGAGALSFAEGMISSIGSAGLKIGGHISKTDNKIANIIFICEYLLGMPIVSTMVVSCDAKKNSQTFSIGPCFRETTTSTTLKMHKDTYMFVTPTFIKKYAGDLESVTTDQEYLEFVDYLSALVSGDPIITAVQVLGNVKGTPAPAVLDIKTTYAILGAYLDNKGLAEDIDPNTGISKYVKVAWVGADNKPGQPVANAQIQGNIVSFSPSTPMATPTAIGIFFSTVDKPTNFELAVATPMVYTAISDSPTISFTPTTPVNFKKSTSLKKDLTPTSSDAGLEMDTIVTSSLKIIDTSTGSTYAPLSVVFDNTAKKVVVSYTKPGSPAAASGTISFTATTKNKTGGGSGAPIPVSFKFNVN